MNDKPHHRPLTGEEKKVCTSVRIEPRFRRWIIERYASFQEWFDAQVKAEFDGEGVPVVSGHPPGKSVEYVGTPISHSFAEPEIAPLNDKGVNLEALVQTCPKPFPLIVADPATIYVGVDRAQPGSDKTVESCIPINNELGEKVGTASVKDGVLTASVNEEMAEKIRGSIHEDHSIGYSVERVEANEDLPITTEAVNDIEEDDDLNPFNQL